MAESLLTKKIKLALYKHTKCHLLGMYGAFEVVCGSILGYGKEHVDFMTMDSRDEFRCYEIKVSKHDLHSPAAWSFYGDFNYFVVPDFLYQDTVDFLHSVGEVRVGVLVALETSKDLVFVLRKRPLRQRLGFDQRVANLHNMVRSGSRYTTYWVEQKISEL